MQANRQLPTSFVFASAMAGILLACSSAGTGLAGLASTSGGKGGSANSSAPAGSGSGSDSETDNANTPQQVSGSFLTCAFTGSEDSVVQAAKTEPTQQSIGVGCGLYQKPSNSIVPANISGLSLAGSIACDGASPVAQPPLQYFPAGSALQFYTQVSGNQLPCVFRLGVSDSVGRTALFQKSIATITQFNGTSGFDVNADVAALGLVFDPITDIWSVQTPAAAPTPAPANDGVSATVTAAAAPVAAPAASATSSSADAAALATLIGGGIGAGVKASQESSAKNGTSGTQTSATAKSASPSPSAGSGSGKK